ncbi:hypothetical protein J6590_021108 [Homalodisca vitripennis]|nr:hypothetical protein J6590_021108 [Homalodisca vitripennis]
MSKNAGEAMYEYAHNRPLEGLVTEAPIPHLRSEWKLAGTTILLITIYRGNRADTVSRHLLPRRLHTSTRQTPVRLQSGGTNQF